MACAPGNVIVTTEVKYVAVNDKCSTERVAAAFDVLFSHALKEWRSRQRKETPVKVDSLPSRARIKTCDVDKSSV